MKGIERLIIDTDDNVDTMGGTLKLDVEEQIVLLINRIETLEKQVNELMKEEIREEEIEDNIEEDKEEKTEIVEEEKTEIIEDNEEE